MNRCLLDLLFRNSAFLDLIIIPLAKTRSSQVCGICGCRIIGISIEDNGCSTVFLSHIPNIKVAVALLSLIPRGNMQVLPCLAAKEGITIQTKQQGKDIVYTGTVVSYHHSAL